MSGPRPSFINAIGTPLDAAEKIHLPGLEQHLDDQWSAGIDGLLVAGTMGLMQMLREETYRQFVTQSIKLSRSRGEILVGVGDTSTGRTGDRIDFLNNQQVDGVVVLSPWFFPFSQTELVDYYHALADRSRHPLYMYHLPSLTRVEYSMETMEAIARHPNVRGIKCSCDYSWTKELQDRLGDRLRIIVSQATRVVELVREGVCEHLDGIFALAPQWTTALGRACQSEDWARATQFQDRINRLLDVVKQAGVFPAFSAILNARGIEGNFAPAPLRHLDERSRLLVLEQPIVRDLLAGMERGDQDSVSQQVA